MLSFHFENQKKSFCIFSVGQFLLKTLLHGFFSMYFFICHKKLMVNYKLQEEDKERRAEAERIMVENQKKIEEQQRKMAEERLAMIEEQMKFEQEKQKMKKREDKRLKEEQKKILGKGNARPKLSFSLQQTAS